MAHLRPAPDNGSWDRAEDLYARGDPGFVPEIRRITDAEQLGEFAARWFEDRRPEARQLLFAYLDQPLNAFRHEVLVKRLFKRAEAASDDALMARFLVLFDRSVHRVLRDRRLSVTQKVATRAEAEELVRRWKEKGFEAFFWPDWVVAEGGRYVEAGFRVTKAWRVLTPSVPPHTTMWRPTGEAARRPYPLYETVRQRNERSKRLFSLATRRYLRRRAWRYFRRLGRHNPDRYVAAVAEALRCYRDVDAPTGLGLLDNWGLVHILFHHSPALVAHPNGWKLAPGWGLSGLTAAPAFEPLWQQQPRVLLDLLQRAPARAVRQWAVVMVRRDHEALLHSLSHEELFGLLAHEDPTVVELAVEVLRSMPDIGELGIARLLRLLEEPHPDTLDIVAALIEEKISPERVTFEQAVRLACCRPLPTARLGFRWLKTRMPAGDEDVRALLRLVEAPCEPLRPEMVRWAIETVQAFPQVQPEWALEFLDSRHSDVREAGWAWLLRDERLAGDITLWRKLLESPYDDIRLSLVALMEERAGQKRRLEVDRLDDDLLRFAWAAVLLNVHRGSRVKPRVVGQLVRRLERRPEEAGALLPVLAVALRSVRGPEWRAGLAGLVRLLERQPAIREAAETLFPELKLTEIS